MEFGREKTLNLIKNENTNLNGSLNIYRRNIPGLLEEENKYRTGTQIKTNEKISNYNNEMVSPLLLRHTK
jgi:hypothetical protein